MKGRGAGFNTANRFLRQELVWEHPEGLDEPIEMAATTRFNPEYPKVFVNKVNSPDLHMEYSMNPYQGCEHGCIYCYARNSHTYWGMSAGLDFEQKILYKPEAPQLFRKFLSSGNYQCKPIMLSGNTDCYQPGEARFGLTRKLLETALEFRQPINLITKNALILRDAELLAEMAKLRLVQVMISITTLDETIRRKMEPRTVSALKRLEIIRELSGKGVHTGVIIAPIIPGLTSDEIPSIMEAAGKEGARMAGYTLVRLNGDVAALFKEWLLREFPARHEKIWHQIQDCHGGGVNDSQFGRRMKGQGVLAKSIAELFRISRSKFIKQGQYELDTNSFRVPGRVVQLGLF